MTTERMCTDRRWCWQ